MNRQVKSLKDWTIVLLTPFVLFNCTVLAKYSGGSGDPNDPYQIANVTDLLTLAADVNDYNKCFIMTADIDLDPNLLGNQVFTTAVIAPDWQVAFTGDFNGNNNKIRNMVIDTQGASGSNLGLFGATGLNSNIRKLCLKNAIIQTGNESYTLGLIVGYNAGNITNCSATGLILAEGDWTNFIGGLVGDNKGGKISMCQSNVSVSGFYYVGGLVGINNSGTIFRCCATGEVFGADYAGGLVADNTGTIVECWATGDVYGIYNGTGGLVGSGDGTIINCYATGEVSGNWYVGGLAGSDATIIYCYSTGKVSGEEYVGGLIGNGIPENVSNSFWDVNTSRQTTSAGGTGKTTEEMQTQSTFTDAGWDYVWETVNGPNDIWAICEDVNYPKLAWQYIVGDSDNDKDVDFVDFAPLGLKWLQADSHLYCGGSDLTGDGLVNLDDLDAFVENWLQ